MNKRTFIKTSVVTGIGISVVPKMAISSVVNNNGDFVQSELPYAYNALEPYIDAKTMELHYSKHHAGYTAKFNSAVIENGLTGKPIEEIFSIISALPDSVRNNGGGYYNHSLFWSVLSPNGGGDPKDKLKMAISNEFGSFENFKNEFNSKALSVFGSGWVWLITDENKKLIIAATANQDNTLMDTNPVKGKPLLTLDVWEHAYYLKYQNRRKEYIEAYWNIVNWQKAEELFVNA